MNPKDILNFREECPLFRILILGAANAGKTTILKRVCDTIEDPEIFSPDGEKVREEYHRCRRIPDHLYYTSDPT